MRYEWFRSSKNHQWYWRLRADNNKDIIAVGGEGYKDKRYCLHGVNLVKSSDNTDVVEVDG